jgi:hypothetical protein
MSTVARPFSELVDAFGRGWNRFWFTPADPAPCAVLRIAVGLLTVLHLATLSFDLERWYSRDGLLPPETVHTLITGGREEVHYHLTYLGGLGGAGLWMVHAVAISAAVAFTTGLFTRVSGVLTLVAVLAYVHRVPQVAGHAEPALAFLLLYLCIAPSGAMLSIDGWMRRRRAASLLPAGVDDPGQLSVVANIGQRLIQVHLAMFVAMMGLTKLYGDAWWDGEAIWLLLAQPYSRPFDLTGLRDWAYTLNLWTHTVVYFELAFPVFIWTRVARPLLVILAAIVWLSLTLATGLWLFGLTLVVASTAFLPASAFCAILPTASRSRAERP